MVILSNGHIVKWPYCQMVILSNGHIAKWPMAIWSKGKIAEWFSTALKPPPGNDQDCQHKNNSQENGLSIMVQCTSTVVTLFFFSQPFGIRHVVHILSTESLRWVDL